MSDYTRLTPAAIRLLQQKAGEGYYISSHSNRGFSDFLNELSTFRFDANQELPHIKEPLGRAIFTGLTEDSYSNYAQIAIEFLLVPTHSNHVHSSLPSIVLNNIATGYLTPIDWPNQFPPSVRQHLPPPVYPIALPSPYTTLLLSPPAIANLMTLGGLNHGLIYEIIDPYMQRGYPTGYKPATFAMFITAIASNPNTRFIDNRPQHLLSLSNMVEASGMAPQWFELYPQMPVRVNLDPDTMEFFISIAHQFNITSRSGKDSHPAIVSATLEAIGQDCLRML